jgi:hypothetical protein
MMTIPSRSSRINPPIGESAEHLVHALAGTADHRRELRLGQRRQEADRAVGRGLPLGGQANQPGRQAAGPVEELQLLHLGRQPAQLGRQRDEEGIADRRPGRDQTRKRSRGSMTDWVATSAVAVADRGAPSRSSSSPKGRQRGR